ncbi:uncharacterized protein B0H18DRAFT_1119140 [Fomitopsis serialis]|uniref:uncharacterized protein n=1 Tax=Fomitopsis serialis TaxID=139415 RepID=UPI002008DD5F|nr:uncharacterized protein B0H18DRAFT_1119140 [Neoantrodia serialis]KAH9925974.1 hypothetical protein B0H18DRAFT_1119140 [Neoantrodia serialis]
MCNDSKASSTSTHPVEIFFKVEKRVVYADGYKPDESSEIKISVDDDYSTYGPGAFAEAWPGCPADHSGKRPIVDDEMKVALHEGDSSSFPAGRRPKLQLDILTLALPQFVHECHTGCSSASTSESLLSPASSASAKSAFSRISVASRKPFAWLQRTYRH